MTVPTNVHTATVVFGEAKGDGLLLKPGANLKHGLTSFTKHYGTPPTSLEEDLLVLASAIFACDLAFKRGEREAFTRQIHLVVPVVNLAAFEQIKSALRFALYSLSHEAWDVSFVARNGSPEANGLFVQERDGKALLFSGGLDSFSAAVQYGDAGETVELVSHITANTAVRSSQEKLYEYIQAKYPGQFKRSEFRVGGHNMAAKGLPFPSDSDREGTQRTRSFLFLALAAIVARRSKIRDVVMIAENGQMAIHLPLTAARISAFSTHTAHPEYVAAMGPMMSTLLKYEISITNPYLYLTKAEVVKEVVANHAGQLEHAVSCWKASRVGGEHNHCGFCVPCLIRRISVEAHGLYPVEYDRDLLNQDIGALSPDDDGKRNLIELGEFVQLLASGSQGFLEGEYPELFNNHIDAVQAVEMYKRFAMEAQGVFRKYPLAASVLL